MCYNCLVKGDLTEAYYRGPWASKDEELPEVEREQEKSEKRTEVSMVFSYSTIFQV